MAEGSPRPFSAVTLLFLCYYPFVIIDGKKLASEIKEQLKQKVAGLARPPRMAIFSVEPNAVTERYLSLKQKF